MLSIGEFSKICQVTTRTLRHYDDINLIKPVMINKENNYRFYGINQIRHMLLITRLKNYNFSLEEIKDLISINDKNYILGKIQQKEEDIKARINAYKDIEKQMQEDIFNLKKGFDIMSFVEKIEIKLVNTEDMFILNSRQRMSVDEYGKYIGKLFELVASKNFKVVGPPMSIYHDESFNHDDNDTEVALPISENNEYTRILKGGLYATAEVKGPYSNLSSGYGKLVEWIDKNNYEFDGSPYEKYISGPIDKGEIVTEIYFPIRKKN